MYPLMTCDARLWKIWQKRQLNSWTILVAHTYWPNDHIRSDVSASAWFKLTWRPVLILEIFSTSMNNPVRLVLWNWSKFFQITNLYSKIKTFNHECSRCHHCEPAAGPRHCHPVAAARATSFWRFSAIFSEICSRLAQLCLPGLASRHREVEA